MTWSMRRSVTFRGRPLTCSPSSTLRAAVERVRPDVKGLLAVDARGVILTAPGGAGADYVARFFAPRIGALEDAATGSIQPALGPYWAARLGKSELIARQLSAQGGIMRVRVASEIVSVAGVTTIAEGREIPDPTA